jgi:hypothetical protein
MKPPLHACLAAVLLALAVPCAMADGGAVLAQSESGPYRVVLFGAPAPLRAGWNDLTVLVQDKATGEPVLDRAVTVAMEPAGGEAPKEGNWVPPCCRLETDSTARQTATHAAASNKVLYAAPFLLREPGRWNARVEVDGVPAVEAGVEILPPLAPWRSYWTYLGLPFAAGAFLLLHVQARRRSAAS